MTRAKTSIATLLTLIVSALLGAAVNAGLAIAQTDTATTSVAELPVAVPAPEMLSTTTVTVAPEAPLTLARIIGTKYVDYCSDGKAVIAYPGDPQVDANLSAPDAQTPKCPAGMTWDHTSGFPEYDTATGDLEVNSYAALPNGTYAVRLPATTYRDATSTSEWAERTVIMNTVPTASIVPAAPTTESPQL